MGLGVVAFRVGDFRQEFLHQRIGSQDRGAILDLRGDLGTSSNLDEIIVLDHGLVVERGTHDELMKQGGSYAELVTSE